MKSQTNLGAGTPLKRLFKDRRGEERLVALLLVHSLGVGITRSFTYTATNALFLSRYDASKLPIVYVAAAVVTSLIGICYGPLADRFPFRRLGAFNLFFTVVSLLGLRGLLATTDAAWPTMVGAILYELLWALATLEFWGLAGRLLDVRQAKRLYGLIGAGEISATIVGGFVLGPLVGVIGTPNLLVVAAGGGVISLVAFRALASTHADRLGGGGEAEGQGEVGPAPRDSRSSRVTRRYLRFIFVAVGLSLTTYYFVDLAFFTQTSALFPDADSLAAFLGPFTAVVNVAALLLRAFFTGPLLSRYGLAAGLLALPFLVGLGSAGVVGTRFISGGASFVFLLMAVTRLVDDSLRESVDSSSVQLLYQPLSPEARTRAMALSEGLVGPIASGSAGVILLLLERFVELDAVRVCAMVFVIAVAWFGVGLGLRKSYTKVLMEALGRRRLRAENVSFTDGNTVNALRRGLRSPHAPEAIYCLGVLEGVDPAQHEAALGELLTHPSPIVRRDVVERVERLGARALLEGVRTLANSDPDPGVRGAAIRTLCALGEDEVLDEVVGMLGEAQPEVRLGVMVGLLRHGGIEGVLAAGDALGRCVRSPDPAERAFAARVLGEVRIRSFHRPLLPLLDDPDTTVRREALRAAGMVGHWRVWPTIVARLGHPTIGTTAAAALAAGGVEVVSLLEPELRSEGASGPHRAAAAAVLGMVGGGRAVAALRARFDEPVTEVRQAVYRALAKCGWRPSPAEAVAVRAAVDREIACAAWFLAVAADLGDSDPLLLSSLENGFDCARARALLLLCFLFPLAAEIAARLNAESSASERRAYAVEALDNLLPQELKPSVLPLFEELPVGRRLQLLGALFPQEQRPAQHRIEEIIGSPPPWVTPWMRACGVHAVGALRLTACWPAVEGALADAEPLVSQTASWAADRLGKDLATSGAKGARTMYPTIERILILKSADIFSEVPDDQLIPLAGIVAEVEVRAGEPVFAKGDSGTSMFVVVEGSVRVHDGERTFRELGPRQVFGELSALDPEPRSASVTALEDTLLFRIDQEPLLELLTGQPAVVSGVIRTLCRLVRNRPVAK